MVVVITSGPLIVVMAGIVLANLLNPWWILLSAFAGLNMIQASFTGFCPAATIFKKLGVKPGPVAEACKEDIQRCCAEKKHNGEVRACLTKLRDKIAPTCKAALESTRGGRRRNAPS